MNVTSIDAATPFASGDGSEIRELFGPATTPAVNQSLAEATIAPGSATRRHHHRELEEIYLITAGRGRLNLDGEERDLGPGDAVLIPPGTWHEIAALGDEPLRLICACAPAYRPDDVHFV